MRAPAMRHPIAAPATTPGLAPSLPFRGLEVVVDEGDPALVEVIEVAGILPVADETVVEAGTLFSSMAEIAVICFVARGSFGIVPHFISFTVN
jgi:hypothetical protein